MARIRYALRTFRKAPLLPVVVVLSLGLGIGANTAIFSFLHQIVLSALPVPHPERLVLLKYPAEFKEVGSTSDNDSGGAEYIFDWRMFREFEKHTEVAQLAGFHIIKSNIAFARQTLSGFAMLVSGRYFAAMAVRPYAGRLIEPGDDAGAEGNPVAVLDYAYWRDRLGGEPVLNQRVTVDGMPFTIVGVAPPGFSGTTVGQQPSLYVPIGFRQRLTPGWPEAEALDWYWVYIVARLNPGVSPERLQAVLNPPFQAIAQEIVKTKDFPKAMVPRLLKARLTVEPGKLGHSDFRSFYANALEILMAATGLVLLIAMANAANLLLARSAERRKEFAVRAAIGAGRGELMGQFLTEALLLSAAGCGLGLGIAKAGTAALAASVWNPDSFAVQGLNWPVLLFSIALSMAAGVLVGIYPAWDAARTPVAAVLAADSGKASGTRGARRLRMALVSTQVLISVVLLVPTGLFVRSLVNLLHVDLGIRTDNTIGFNVVPRLNGYSPEKIAAVLGQAEERLAAIPGAQSVASSSVPLIGGSNWGTGVRVEGTPVNQKSRSSRTDDIGPGFFGKMGIPLIAGREILESDTAAAPKVAVVNQEFVKQFCGGRNPLGVMLQISRGNGFDTRIVGVVRDSHYAGVRQKIPPVFYRPWRQDPRIGDISFYIRTALPPSQMAAQIRETMRSVDRNLPIEDLRTLDDQVHYNLRNDELALRLAGAFAVLATVLAMLGLYGVMAYSVARRTREIGIRMALGAAPGRIRRLIFRELLWILGIGLGLGIPTALAGARLTASQLFGVKPFDAAVVAAAATLLAITAVVAAFLPAHRAARVNPLNALRHD